MVGLNYQMVLIVCQIFKIKNMKHYQQFLLFMFTSIKINNRLVFKIKDGYKLELETPEK